MNKKQILYKKTVTIGIAAYNAEKNIANLLKSVLSQKADNYILEKVLIHSDASTDQTVQIIKTLRKKHVLVIDSPIRIGFTKSFEALLKKSQSDIALILNDDIQVKDLYFVQKVVKEFSAQYVGLVSANPVPLTPRTFIEKACISEQNVFIRMRNSMRDTHSVYTCDGKALALSAEFIKSLNIPKDAKKAGNLDCYLYFHALKKGFTYRHCRQAKLYFRTPSTLIDYIRWTSRNNANYFLMKNIFGDIVQKEFKKPAAFYFFMIHEFFKNPLGSLYIKILALYISVRARAISQNFSPLWNVITTSKNLK